MKNRAVAIVLILICVILSFSLFYIKKQAADEKGKDTDRILSYSNQFVETSTKWEEQKQVTTMMEKDLDAQKKSFLDLTNNYSTVAGDLAKAQADLKSRNEDLAQRKDHRAGGQKPNARPAGGGFEHLADESECPDRRNSKETRRLRRGQGVFAIRTHAPAGRKAGIGTPVQRSDR